MSDKWKKILIAGIIAAVVMLVGAVATQYLNYPTSEHLAVEQRYWDAAAADDEAEMSRLDATPEMRHVNQFTAVSMLVGLALYAVVTYGVYAYSRKHRLSARKSVGLTAIIVTLASIASSLLAAQVHAMIVGADSVDISLGAVLWTAPLVFVLSFVVASVIEYIYKRRNSFEM